MTDNIPDLRIDQERFQHDFQELCQIGAYGEDGVYRPAFSEAHLEARAWFAQKATNGGLELRIDGAGNHSARLDCGPENAPPLLIGSHLDSVPRGGRFDGALGVLAALEVVRRVKELGVRLPFNLEAIDFTDEEGTLVSFLGSRALCGQLTIANLENPRGDKDVLNIGLERAGLTYESILSARRNPATIGGYLELHVEQGPVLEAEGVQIGIVERISGLSFQRLRYLGEAAHAGSVDMTRRKDAAQGAAAFTLAARQIVIEQFPGCFSNVGDISISPGYFNIIPDLATVEFEFRAADEQQFRDLESALLLEAEAASRRFGLKLEREFIGERLPVAMSEQAIGAIRVAVTNLGLRSMNIVSRAGHDAQAMATICPSGMIFVSSRDGVSHSPKEYTAWNDCVNGANVLLQAALNYPWYQE